jgi:hypothetical protein
VSEQHEDTATLDAETILWLLQMVEARRQEALFAGDWAGVADATLVQMQLLGHSLADLAANVAATRLPAFLMPQCADDGAATVH